MNPLPMHDPTDNEAVTTRQSFQINPGRILLVESEVSVAKLYKSYLNDIFSVTIAHSGKEAIDQLSPDFDVILLGRDLKEWKGRDVLSSIHDRGLQAQVTLMSERAPEPDIATFSIDEYLVKPVSRKDLRLIVSDLYSRRKCTFDNQELLALVSRRIALKSSIAEEELERSQCYQKLERRIEIATDHLETNRQGSLSNDFPNTTCPGCGTNSTSQPNGQVNFIQLTAWTWKCTRCGYLINISERNPRKIHLGHNEASNNSHQYQLD